MKLGMGASFDIEDDWTFFFIFLSFILIDGWKEHFLTWFGVGIGRGSNYYPET